MRLIDADKLKAKVRAQEWKRDPTIMLALDWIYMLIDNSPTIDAVPVVRCSECRFRNTSWYDKRDMFESFCRWDRDESPNDDDYCSYGEKMEDKS